MQPYYGPTLDMPGEDQGRSETREARPVRLALGGFLPLEDELEEFLAEIRCGTHVFGFDVDLVQVLEAEDVAVAPPPTVRRSPLCSMMRRTISRCAAGG